MLAGDIYAPRKIRLVEAPEPQLSSHGEDVPKIIFQPELACLCGSDLLFFEADYPEYAPHVGQSLHEMIGKVTSTNGQRFAVGDRVLCVPHEHFGLCERFAIDETRAIPVDPRPAPEHALMAQPLGTVICALKKLPSVLDQDVAVVGQGPMGQLWTLALRSLGARQIIALDLLDYRLEQAQRLGATAVINPSRQDAVPAVEAVTNGQGADLVVEVVGHREQVLNLCVDLCRPHGQIMFFGVPPETFDGIRWKDLFWKNLNVQTSVMPDFERDFPLAMQWIAERRVDVAPLITHRFDLGDIQLAFDLFSQRQDRAVKVLIDFPGSELAQR